MRCVGSCTRIAASAPTVFVGSLCEPARNADAVVKVGAPNFESAPWHIQQCASSTCCTLHGGVSAVPTCTVHWHVVPAHCETVPSGQEHVAAPEAHCPPGGA